MKTSSLKGAFFVSRCSRGARERLLDFIWVLSCIVKEQMYWKRFRRWKVQKIDTKKPFKRAFLMHKLVS
jgi:hypothetical protein